MDALLPFHSSGKILPSLALQTLSLHLGWALVLAAVAAYLLRPFPKALRFAGVGIVGATQLLPGWWSPGWWLGLAFQSPSLTLQGISLLYLVRMWQLRNTTPVVTIDSAAYARWPSFLLLVAVVVGWVFVLDMVALLELQLYAVGFTPYAVLASSLVAAVFELWSLRFGHPPALQKYRDSAFIIVGAMAAHMLFRLPNGNAWDALMDPWLWLIAHAMLLSRTAVWLALLTRIKIRKLVELWNVSFSRRR